MKAKISEIFKSIQGEGKYVGEKQVFVRFFKCHMHCHWCDTPYAIGDRMSEFSSSEKLPYQEMLLEELFKEIRRLWSGCHSVTLTGGEPLLQKDIIRALIPRLRLNRMPVHLETSGVLYEALKEVIAGVDMVSMDIKLPSSTRCQAFWREHAEFLKIARHKDVFIKAVISCTTTQEDVLRAVRLVHDIDPNIMFILQPNSFDLSKGVMNLCQEFKPVCQEHLNDVRIMPQIHHLMGVR